MSPAIAAEESIVLTTAARGTLWVTPLEHVDCAGETTFVRGESVLLSGQGFASSETARIVLVQGDTESDIVSVTTKADGTLQTTVAVPAAVDTAQPGRLRAKADKGHAGTGVVLTSDELRFADAGDTDGDGSPDICDNCAGVANADLADEDGDGIGDACDPCPLDGENDGDGDGLCADVDPDPYG